MRKAKFKQLNANNVNRRTLYQSGGSFCYMDEITVDRNGDGVGGGLNTAAGIWIYNCARFGLKNVEVFGNDYGSGIVIQSCKGFADNLYVHDIRGGNSSSAVMVDDTVQGIWLYQQQAQSFTLVNPRVINLSNQWSGQAAFPKFTRGIAVGGCYDLTILGGTVDSVDQGIDISGDENPVRFSVIGVHANNCYTWGFKCANTIQHGEFTSCVAYRAGQAGFVSSAPSVTLSAITQKIDYTNCKSIGSGYGGQWTAFNTCGFRIASTGLYPDYPRAIRYIGCTADADTATMKYGFLSDATFGGSGDSWNEAINCSVVGASVDDYVGLHQGYARRALSANQTLTNNTFTSLGWTNSIIDRMSTTGADNTEIKIQRSGLYLVQAGVEFAGNAAGTRAVRIFLNGAEHNGSRMRVNAVDANTKNLTVNIPIACDIGDIIKVQVYQDCGANLDVTTSTAVSIMLISSGMGRT
jgi:hypothetical protein